MIPKSAFGLPRLFFLIGICLGHSFLPVFANSNDDLDKTSPKKRQAPNWCEEKSKIRVNTGDRLRMLRSRIRFYDYAAYIITSDDEHQSEYPADYDKRREYITGFTGSVGTAVVLIDESPDAAALWVDGRYDVQAEAELDCNWTIMKSSYSQTPKLTDWLGKKMQGGPNKIVAADPKMVSQKQWREWKTELSAFGLNLVESNSNLIDDIWKTSTGRPPEPNEKVKIQELKYTGKEWERKVSLVRKDLALKHVDALILTDLDEIAWLLNMRGSDIHYIPVFKSFVFLTEQDISLYIKSSKMTQATEKHLNVNGCMNNPCIQVKIKKYEDAYSDVKRTVKALGLKISMSDSASYAIYSMVPKEQIVLGETSPHKMMVVKNVVESEGLKKALFRDCIALSEFFAMLEKDVQEGNTWDEMSAGKAVELYRRHQELYKGPSFTSISAFGPNAALPHYSPQVSTSRSIDTSSLYLLDSGGQYLDGTTDITRTMHFGQPTEYQKETYTRVLQGVIALASLIFPSGTKDNYVEISARQFLYNLGLDYAHGTGHGVGSYLNVHEYPPLINSRMSGQTLLPGMFFSIEPGYYEPGQFGIRLETIFTVVETQTEYHFQNKSFFKFQPVSFIPFEPKLIQFEVLTKPQVKWLNEYNAKTLNSLGLELRRQNKLKAYNWVLARTEHISQGCDSSATRLVRSDFIMLSAICIYFIMVRPIAMFEIR